MINEKVLRQIEEEALMRSNGDVALWFHNDALLEGELRIKSRGKDDFNRWRLVKKLPQYKAAEASVVMGWRKFIQNTLGLPQSSVAKRRRIRPSARVRERIQYLPGEQQADDYAINRALILDGLRRAKNEEQAAKILKARAQTIRAIADSEDIDFFRSLGRLLSQPPRSSLQVYEYARAILSNWLTGFLWLMRERTASDCLAHWCGHIPKTVGEGDKELRHFKEIKRDYKLKSHKPALIDRIDPDGKLILTPQGRILFDSRVSSK